MVGAGIAEFVPHDPGLGILAVGGDLHDGARAVFVELAQRADVLFLIAIAVEIELIGFERVHTEFGFLPGFYAFRPGVAEQFVREQAEMMWSVGGEVDLRTLGTETVFLQGDGVGAGGAIGEDFAGSPRAGFDVQRLVGDLELYVV